jgi:hypothetical protein
MSRRQRPRDQKRVHRESQRPTSPSDHSSPWVTFSGWSRKRAWRRVAFGFVVVIIISGMVGAAVPQIGGAIEYAILKVRLPAAFDRTLSDGLTSKSGVRVVERRTTLDLTGWKWTSLRDLESTRKLSRGLSLNSFVLRKTEPGAKYFVHTVSSGSLAEPSIWCDSHPFRIVQANSQASSNIRQWNVLVDVSEEPDDHPFTVNLMVTFWNGFQTKEDWWSGFRVLHSTEKATYRVIFPARLPAAKIKFRFKDIPSGETVYLNTARLNVAPVPGKIPMKTVRWVVDDPLPDRSYQVAWTWPESAAAADQPSSYGTGP